MKTLEKDEIVDALLKKAMGYDVEEVVEEFSIDENSGKMKKNKKKVSKKHIPPDIPAVKAILELCENNLKSRFDNMTEQQLLEEKQKLLKLLEKTN